MEVSFSTFAAWKHVNGFEGTIDISGARLHDLQSVLCGMLEDIVNLCAQRQLRIMMGGGSCLGAIRHEGFIPWDDDMDLNILRADLPDFLEAIQEEFPDKYSLQEVQSTPEYDLAFVRVRLRGTVLRSRDDVRAPAEECGVYVDIFVIENVPDNALLRGVHGFGSLLLGFAYSCARFYKNRDMYLKWVVGSQEIGRVFKLKAHLGRLFSFLSPPTWCRLWDRWNSLCGNAASKYLSIPAGRGHYFGELYRRSDFFPISYGCFEGLKVPLPAKTDTYMRALYGPDYMVPPPIEEQETHIVLEFDLGESCS